MTWNQPYLETCCRAALHRMFLAEDLGRPDGLKDGPCLARLAGLGFCGLDSAGRYRLTAAGSDRHLTEVMGLVAQA